MSLRSMTSAALALSLLAPSLASAEEGVTRPTMGARGTVVLGADLRGIVDRTEVHGEDLESETWTFGLRPSLDYFLADGLSVGGTLVLQNRRQTTDYDDDLGLGDTEDRTTTTGGSLRIGAHATVAPRISVWIRAGAGLEHSEGEHEPSDDFGSETTFDTFFLDGSALILLHLAPSFFLAAGPGVVYRDNEATYDGDVDDVDIESASESTSFGLRVEIGGYW